MPAVQSSVPSAGCGFPNGGDASVTPRDAREETASRRQASPPIFAAGRGQTEMGTRTVRLAILRPSNSFPAALFSSFPESQS